MLPWSTYVVRWFIYVLPWRMGVQVEYNNEFRSPIGLVCLDVGETHP